jgi:glutamyl/glutaminyl-tRNA synthetase
MLWRDDGSPTYHLASVVDDGDFGVTHVVRGNDHRPNEDLHRRLHEALGTQAPEYVHHGLILGPDGKKMSKRDEGATIASLRELGIPPEAVRRYLEQLGLPKHDVRYDLPRIRRYAIETIAALPDEELAARVGVPVSAVPVLRGARDLVEARANADAVLNSPSDKVSLGEKGPVTVARFRELAERANGNLSYDAAKALVRELKAVGGDLRALRVALTGRDRGPELAAVVAALDRDETLRRLDAAV